MPDRLTPKATKFTLAMSVRKYFYALYNVTNSAFKEMLISVGNRDAVTGNRMFDRHEAVRQIKDAARAAKDTETVDASDGDIYKYISREQKKQGHGLKLRRREYARLTHQQVAPAE